MRYLKIFRHTVLFCLLTFTLVAQPIKFTSEVPNRVRLLDKVFFSASVDQQIVEKYRFRLVIPGAWRGGLKYAWESWSDWYSNNKFSVLFSNFVEEGTYKFVVEYRKRGKIFTDKIEIKFEAYWEYPEIRKEGLTIDYNWINSAKSEKEKYLRASEEYKKAYNLWYKKYLYETKALKLTQSPVELLEGLAKTVVIKGTGAAVVAAGAPLIAISGLTGYSIAGLIKQGYTSLILIYRNIQANQAASMAAISKAAYEYCLAKAR